MKRLCVLLVLLCLLAGCAATQTPAPTEAPTETETAVDEQLLLAGVWRNEGQYEDGRDFVETMTLDLGGRCTIVLDYQGVTNYQTLEGVYSAENGMLYTTLQGSDGNSFDRNFRYTLAGDTLTLETDSKTVVYVRIT